MPRLALLASLIAGCASAPAAPRPAPAATEEARERAPALEAGALLRSPSDRSTRRCIIARRSGGELRLGLPLEPSVSPAPPPPTDLDAHLSEGDAGFALFTLYGRFGRGALSLAAVTRHAPPIGAIVAIFITRAGAHFQAPGGVLEGPMALEDLTAALEGAGVGEAHLVAVVPDAHAPAASLAAALAAVDARGAEPTLALPLPRGARHASPDQDSMRAPVCESLSPMSGPAGALAAASVREVTTELASGARTCRAASTTFEVARGGALGLLIRVGPDGRVGEACFDEDSIGDPALRACILDRVEALELAPPMPSGSVDVRVPLRFPRDERERARGLCGPDEAPAREPAPELSSWPRTEDR